MAPPTITSTSLALLSSGRVSEDPRRPAHREVKFSAPTCCLCDRGPSLSLSGLQRGAWPSPEVFKLSLKVPQGTQRLNGVEGR